MKSIKSTMLKPFNFAGVLEAAKGIQARRQAIADAWTAHIEGGCNDECKVCEADRQMAGTPVQLPGWDKE